MFSNKKKKKQVARQLLFISLDLHYLSRSTCIVHLA